MEAAALHWSASWPVLTGYVAVAAGHLVGLRLSRRYGQPVTPEAGTERERRREACLFQLGLLVVVLALVSPLGYYSREYVWVRMLQNLLVAVVGPGLIVLGAPWSALRAVLIRRAPVAPTARPAPGTRAMGPRTPWPLSRPVLAVVAANIIWLAWLVPALFDAARSNAGLALIEDVSYLAAGTLFWLQLISSRPFSQPTPPLRRIALVIGSLAVSTLCGMTLVFGSGVFYPAYANSAHHVMTVVDDQQLAGAVWWMGMLPVMIIAAVALMMQWLKDEESAELSAGLDQLLMPRRQGWPSRPVIR